MSGFDNSDLSIANGTLSNVSSSDGGITWTGTFTPTIGVTDATNLITLNNTGVTDLAGNSGLGHHQLRQLRGRDPGADRHHRGRRQRPQGR